MILKRYKTSAKDDVNIDESGDSLVKAIIAKDPKALKSSDKPTGVVDLKGQNGSGATKEEKGCPC
jgi:hypothetical protein